MERRSVGERCERSECECGVSPWCRVESTVVNLSACLSVCVPSVCPSVDVCSNEEEGAEGERRGEELLFRPVSAPIDPTPSADIPALQHTHQMVRDSMHHHMTCCFSV